MTAKELTRIFQKGECLSLDTMRLYIDGKLHQKSMHEVEKHLIECSLCSAAMDGLTPRRMKEVNKLSAHIEKRLAVYMNTPPPVPFFRRFGFAIITGALLLGGGATWWVIAHENNSERPGTDTASVTNNKEQQTFVQPPPAATVSQQVSDRPLDNGAVVVNGPGSNTSASLTAPAKTNNAPASAAPGQQNSAPASQETPRTAEIIPVVTQEQPGGASTRVANSNQPLRIKHVTIYPPVTHSESKSAKPGKGGQISRSGGGDANFQLDEMPAYPGGNTALQAYILENFKPVAIDRSKVTRFSTGVLFTVNAKTGTVSSPELSFPISPEVDAELLRIINAMPDWTPGKKRGEVDVMIGITFE